MRSRCTNETRILISLGGGNYSRERGQGERSQELNEAEILRCLGKLAAQIRLSPGTH